jgi:glutathione peroxidase
MKFIVGIIMLSLMPSLRQTAGLYGIALKNIDGTAIQLGQYQGKKLLFILLPVSAEDTTIRISGIAHLQTSYQSSLVIIGIPSVEAGYKEEDAEKLKKTYKDAGANFIIARGMKVTKGTGQSPLFQWLTNKEMNHHFNRDIPAVGSKCFVDEGGDLYAVIGPKLELTNPLMDRILSRAHVENTKQNKH